MVVNWHSDCKLIVNQLAFDWFISEPANRTLPSIEGSDRLADTEMNSLIRSQLALKRQSIGSQLAVSLKTNRQSIGI